MTADNERKTEIREIKNTIAERVFAIKCLTDELKDCYAKNNQGRASYVQSSLHSVSSRVRGLHMALAFLQGRDFSDVEKYHYVFSPDDDELVFSSKSMEQTLAYQWGYSALSRIDPKLATGFWQWYEASKTGKAAERYLEKVSRRKEKILETS